MTTCCNMTSRSRTNHGCQPPISDSISFQFHLNDAVTSHQTFGKNEESVNNHSDTKSQNALEVITSELKTIRRLLTGLLVGVGVLIGALINPEISVSIAIIGVFFWILLVIAGAILNRAQYKRYEAMRFRELSGMSASANRPQAEQAAAEQPATRPEPK